MMRHMPAIPEPTRNSIIVRLLDHAGKNWPQLAKVRARYHGSFAYITGVLRNGEDPDDVGEPGPAGDLDPVELGPVLFRVVKEPQGDRVAGGVRDCGHGAIVPRGGICAGYHAVPGEGVTPA
jgi:hypothetical protein